jgi:hypothetical protein
MFGLKLKLLFNLINSETECTIDLKIELGIEN